MIIGIAGGILVVAVFLIRMFMVKGSKPKQTKASVQIRSGGLRSLSSTALAVSQPVEVVTTPEIVVNVTPKYKAMVWTDNGIVFKKIPERIGSTFYCDPSMPEKGEHLWVIENIENGIAKYTPYDPREIPIVSEETPEWAYDSIHCYKEVYAWFKNKADMWDKVNTILIGLGIVVMGLVSMTVLGG